MSATPDAQAIEGHAVDITRRLAAPRERVFEAWTGAEHLSKWFCPADFSVLSSAADFRPGGLFTVRMRSPDGLIFEWRNTYREIVTPERLVYASAITDGTGKPLFDAMTRLDFIAASTTVTQLKVHSVIEKLHDPQAAAAALEMEPGWHQALDKLAAHVEQATTPG